MTEKRVEWSKEREFATLDMMQDFTDEELSKLGMTPKDIKEFREWQGKDKNEKPGS